MSKCHANDFSTDCSKQPFLVSMGLSKSLTALVWIAGPFCGAFVQPLVGYFSDRSRNSWGQRRPFIVVGTISTIFSILMLAWTESTIGQFVVAFDLQIQQTNITVTAISLAVFWILALNISIQPLQVGLRALVVDNCPSQQQAQVNAWASLMTGLGNIVGNLLGFTPLPDILGYICRTRFQGLCIIASLAVAVTVPITCYFIVEQNPETMLLRGNEKVRPTEMLRQFREVFQHLPYKVRVVFKTQFFAWLGWFPYLFYATR